MKGYKTIAFNLVMTIVAGVAVLNPDAIMPSEANITGSIDALETAFVGVWGVGNLILRAVTSSAVFKKE